MRGALHARHLACSSLCMLFAQLVIFFVLVFCAHSSRCMFTTWQALPVCLLGTFRARCSACSPRRMLSAPRIASAQPQGCSSPAQAKNSAGAEHPATALLLRSRHVFFGGCLTRLCRVLTFCCLRSPPAAGTGAGHVLKAPAAVLLSRSEPGDKAATKPQPPPPPVPTADTGRDAELLGWGWLPPSRVSSSPQGHISEPGGVRGTCSPHRDPAGEGMSPGLSIPQSTSPAPKVPEPLPS